MLTPLYKSQNLNYLLNQLNILLRLLFFQSYTNFQDSKNVFSQYISILYRGQANNSFKPTEGRVGSFVVSLFCDISQYPVIYWLALKRNTCTRNINIFIRKCLPKKHPKHFHLCILIIFCNSFSKPFPHLNRGDLAAITT